VRNAKYERNYIAMPHVEQFALQFLCARCDKKASICDLIEKTSLYDSTCENRSETTLFFRYTTCKTLSRNGTLYCAVAICFR
jgi:hypothetical protein